jgi:hypothetical protein
MWLLGFELWTFGRAVGCSNPLSHLTSPTLIFNDAESVTFRRVGVTHWVGKRVGAEQEHRTVRARPAWASWWDPVSGRRNRQTGPTLAASCLSHPPLMSIFLHRNSPSGDSDCYMNYRSVDQDSQPVYCNLESLGRWGECGLLALNQPPTAPRIQHAQHHRG